MSEIISTRIVLASRPSGEPVPENFRVEKQAIGELQPGQVMIKVLYLSLDPYMRGRMSAEKSYADPLPIGDVITGESAGIVIESKSDRFKVGDYVCCYSGWQSYYVGKDKGEGIYRVDPSVVPLSSYLGACGMPGRTAYFGLLRLGKPSPGETLVVSAASGAVGSVVGQIGKMQGLRVVGVAGGAEKCAYVTDELGFDACIDYKAGGIEEALRDACPNGIDIYFESVGGAVSEAVAKQLNRGARVPICGYISSYNDQGAARSRTPFQIFGELPDPPEHDFFLVFDFFPEYREANGLLSQWVSQGAIKYRETVVAGLERAPEYFNWLFHGKNFGKLIVQVAADE
jgi:NADPH-dependent curcumin reductase CurA